MRFNSENTETNEHGTLADLVAVYEKSLIVAALRQTGGNVSHAAAILGSTVNILTHRMSKYQINVKDFYIYSGQRKNRIKYGSI